MTPEQYEKQIKKLRKTICCLQAEVDALEATVGALSNDPLAIKFAVVGGDDTAAENRTFDATGFDFTISADGGDSVLALYTSNPTSREFYTVVSAPDAGGTYGYIDLFTQDGGNFFYDMYIQNDDGSVWSNFYASTNSLYIAHSEEVQIQTGSGDIRVDLIEGAGIEVEVALGQTINVNGVVQDDTATQVMALDNSNNVVWVDKSTIVASPEGAPVMVTNGTQPDKGASDVYHSSAYFVVPVPINSTTVFEMNIGMTGASSDTTLSTILNLSGGDIFSIFENITMEYFQADGTVITKHLIAGTQENWEVVWDSEPGYSDDTSGIFRITGTLCNQSGAGTTNLTFRYKTVEGIAAAQMGIAPGSTLRYMNQANP